MARPPCPLITRLMQRIVVDVAQGDGEFVRHLKAQGAWLREANVMRLGGAAAADETWLAADKGDMRLIAHAHLFGDEQSAGGVEVADGPTVGGVSGRDGFAADDGIGSRSDVSACNPVAVGAAGGNLPGATAAISASLGSCSRGSLLGPSWACVSPSAPAARSRAAPSWPMVCTPPASALTVSCVVVCH